MVCIFHLEQSFKCISLGMGHLSAFRMSAFFFISGVLFSTRRFPNFKSYFVHKSKVLLLPYLALSILFLLLDPVVYDFSLFPRAPRMTIMNIRPEILCAWDYICWNLAKIFVAGKSSIGSGPIWFVFTLYSISLMFYVVHGTANKISGAVSAGNRKQRIQKIFIFITAAASLAAGWALYKNHIRLPLGIERDLTTLFFFACGFLCKDFIKLLQKLKIYALAPLAVTAFVLYGYIEDPNPYFSIMNNDLGKSFLTFFGSSISGIIGLISSFIILSKLPRLKPLEITKGIFRNISRNALIILAVHWWALLVLRIVFKIQLDKPGIVFVTLPIIIAICMIAIPLFRCKLHKLIGKEKISAKESLSIS